MPRFEPHGNAQIELHGCLLRIEPDGPGNAEEIERLLQHIDALFGGPRTGPWAALLIAGPDTLLTPDAEAKFKQALPRLVTSGHAGMAIADLDGAIRGLLELQFGRLYRQAGLPFAVFTTEAQAADWLRSELQARAE